MGLLDPPVPQRLPRFSHIHAFANSFGQGAGSDGGTVIGGGGFVGKTAEALAVDGAALMNHSVGGSSMGLDQGSVSGNSGYAMVLTAFQRRDQDITTNANAGPRTFVDPTIEPTVNVSLGALPLGIPYAGGSLEARALGNKKFRYGGYDSTGGGRLTFVYDVDELIPSGTVLKYRATKRQSKRWSQWPEGESRMVILGPHHDWLGVGSATVAPMIQSYRAAICRALAANIIAGDGDSFNGGTGLVSQSVDQSGAVSGSRPNWYTPAAGDGTSYFEVTVPGDAVGCALVFGFALRNGQTATWRISVNGTDHGDCVLAPAATSTRYAGSAYRIPAADLPKGAVVRARCVAQSAQYAGPVDYVSLETRRPTAPVIVMGTTRYPADNNANDALVAQIVQAQKNLVNEFARPDGRNPVRFVDADAILGNLAENFYTDNQHPSELGHQRMHEAVMKEIRIWARQFT